MEHMDIIRHEPGSSSTPVHGRAADDLMIIIMGNTYICGFRSCCIISPTILPRIFFDFPFARKVLWEQVTTGAFSVSLSLPIENFNFEGMLALPLTLP